MVAEGKYTPVSLVLIREHGVMRADSVRNCTRLFNNRPPKIGRSGAPSPHSNSAYNRRVSGFVSPEMMGCAYYKAKSIGRHLPHTRDCGSSHTLSRHVLPFNAVHKPFFTVSIAVSVKLLNNINEERKRTRFILLGLLLIILFIQSFVDFSLHIPGISTLLVVILSMGLINFKNISS
mgnify:CR=1 FL=1